MGIGLATARSKEAGLEDSAQAASWVLRRVGFGATPQDQARAAEIGIDRFLDELFDPEAHSIVLEGDPWDGVDMSVQPGGKRKIGPVIGSWAERFRTSNQPLSDWLAWYWHGHLTSSAAVVISPEQMARQIRMYRELGGGPFRELLKQATVSGAMLRYLDGGGSSGKSPNENYSRELLELFALGVGNYTEDDIAAGARALTGWAVVRRTYDVKFRPGRHDQSPQNYLGVDGVNDLDSVMDAVVGSPACAPFLANRLAERICGPESAKEATGLVVDRFASDGLVIKPLIRELVELGLGGLNDPFVLAPIPWLIGAMRATGADGGKQMLSYGDVVKAMEQIPLMPPNVAGWPEGEYWFSASITSARLKAAQMVAEGADADSPAMIAAESGDLDELGLALGIPSGYGATTADALFNTGSRGRTLLALALSSPEAVIA